MEKINEIFLQDHSGMTEKEMARISGGRFLSMGGRVSFPKYQQKGIFIRGNGHISLRRGNDSINITITGNGTGNTVNIDE